MRHQGALGVSFSTRMPTAEEPLLGLDISLRDGDRPVGSVGVVVDLRAIQGHIASRMGRDGAESMESLVENHRAGPKAAGTPIVRRVRGPKGASRRRGLKDRPEPRLRRIRVDSTAKLRRFQVSTRGRQKERLALGGHETSAG